jgi:farnesyl-diphosphate farnesyltransferase
MTEIEDLLQKTSRTFALTIPLLPEPTRAEVGVAYLLFRVIDTFEDATRWDGTRKIEALNRFVHLVGQPPAQAVELAADCGRDPPLNHPGYLELLSKLPQVLQAFAGLEPRAQAIIHEHVRRSADGMGEFVAREAASGRLQLHDLDDLRDYCYTVAGIVG